MIKQVPGAAIHWSGPSVGETIVILGAGGTAVDFFEAAQASGNKVLGLLDDSGDSERDGYAVLGPLDAWKKFPGNVKFFLGIGSVLSYAERLKIIERVGIPAQRYATIVHPRATVSPSVVIGVGSGVLAHAVLGARVSVGCHVEILQLCLVGHHCILEDGAILAGGANLGAGVHAGKCVYIGAGASVRNGIHVGDYSLLGMNSTLLENIPPRLSYAGSPARPISRKMKQYKPA